MRLADVRWIEMYVGGARTLAERSFGGPVLSKAALVLRGAPIVGFMVTRLKHARPVWDQPNSSEFRMEHYKTSYQVVMYDRSASKKGDTGPEKTISEALEFACWLEDKEPDLEQYARYDENERKFKEEATQRWMNTPVNYKFSGGVVFPLNKSAQASAMQDLAMEAAKKMFDANKELAAIVMKKPQL